MVNVEVGYFSKFLTMKEIEISVALTPACLLMTCLEMSHFYHQLLHQFGQGSFLALDGQV